MVLNLFLEKFRGNQCGVLNVFCGVQALQYFEGHNVLFERSEEILMFFTEWSSKQEGSKHPPPAKA